MTTKIISLTVLSLGLMLSLASVELGPNDTNSGAADNSKTAIIDSANGGCFYFADARTTCPSEEANDPEPDIRVEPWCTQNPGLCGNWAETAFTNMDDANEIPTTGYISDEAGFIDCQEVSPNQVLFFKLSDGSFAKAIVSDDAYTETESVCNHRITLDYIYPVQ